MYVCIVLLKTIKFEPEKELVITCYHQKNHRKSSPSKSKIKIFILERGKGRERKREKNIDMTEKH